DLHDLARFVVDGEPNEVILTLVDYAISNLGRPIYSDVLRRFINENTSFRLHDLSYAPTIPGALQDRYTEFRDSLAPYLIQSTLIPRPEAESVYTSIVSNARRVHVLHGNAGQGKSCSLLGLVELLRKNDIPCLAVRLDARIPRDNTREFGRTL